MSRPSPHQHHSVVNRNHALAAQRAADRILGEKPILVDNEPHFYMGAELEGRLKVICERAVKLSIPHRLGDLGTRPTGDPANPINQLGALHEACVPLVTTRDDSSLLAAIAKRCDFIQAGKDDDITDECLQMALDIVGEIPDGLFPLWDENDSDRQAWMTKQPPAKQERMKAAYANVIGLTSAQLGVKDISVKQEPLMKRGGDWGPRAIYIGTDEFNSVTGPPSQIVMQRAVHLTRNLHIPIGEVKVEFGYKTNDVSLCKFIKDDPECKHTVEGDFTRNDREQRKRVAIIYDAWLKKLGLPLWYRVLLLDMEVFSIRDLKSGFWAQLKYQLPTGTTSTTPRNSLYNGTMIAVAARLQAVSGRALILGDDILARMAKVFVISLWVKVVSDFKMVLKAKEPKMDGEATFLSRRIFWEVDTPCMVPLLGKMLVRFNVRGSVNDAVSDSQYMAGKALSYAYECRHVPLLSSIFMDRYEMESDKKLVTPQDLTWFAKTSDLSAKDLIKAIKNEPVKVTKCEFGEWCNKQYDLDWADVKALFEQTILQPGLIMLDNPDITHMQMDYS